MSSESKRGAVGSKIVLRGPGKNVSVVRPSSIVFVASAVILRSHGAEDQTGYSNKIRVAHRSACARTRGMSLKSALQKFSSPGDHFWSKASIDSASWS